jgi:hypothetical protein
MKALVLQTFETSLLCLWKGSTVFDLNFCSRKAGSFKYWHVPLSVQIIILQLHQLSSSLDPLQVLKLRTTDKKSGALHFNRSQAAKVRKMASPRSLVRARVEALDADMLFTEKEVTRHSCYAGWNPLSIPSIHPYNPFPTIQIGLKVSEMVSPKTFDLFSSLRVSSLCKVKREGGEGGEEEEEEEVELASAAALEQQQKLDKFVIISRPTNWEKDRLCFRPQYFVAHDIPSGADPPEESIKKIDETDIDLGIKMSLAEQSNEGEGKDR